MWMNKKNLIEYASIIGFLMSDTTKVVTSTYSREDGSFVLDCSSYKNETLRLKINFYGISYFPDRYSF